MTDEQRKKIEERLAWARKELADPWRILRALEAGMGIQAVDQDTEVLRAVVCSCETRLGLPGDLSKRLAAVARAVAAARM